jgi:putative DNA primase/helicase
MGELVALPPPDDEGHDNTPEKGTQDDRFAALLDRPFPQGLADRVRYDHSAKRWHYWDKAHWRVDKTKHVRLMVRERVDLWMRSTQSAADVKMYAALFNESKKTSVLDALSSRQGIAMVGDEWDPDPYLLGVKNGIVDLRTATLIRDERPDLLVTRSCRASYDPARAGDCPLFLKFLSEITGGDLEVQRYLLRLFGYALFGHQAEQKFWLFVGQGNNGKGVLTKLIAWIMGDYAAFPASSLYMRSKWEPSASAARADLMALLGLRFTPTSEPVAGTFNDEMVKHHTGDDPIRARALYSNVEIEFRPTHTLIFSTNNPPKVEDVGKSMQRRVRVVHFLEDFSGERADNNLETTLRSEADAILSLLVQSACAWFDEGLPEPAIITEWSRAYIEDNDPISEFVHDRCLVAPRETAPAKLLYDEYADWARKNTDETLTMTAFGNAMSRRFRKAKTMKGASYLGISIMSAVDQALKSGDKPE